MKLLILGLTADNSPLAISQSLLDSLAEKTGSEQNSASCQGVRQKEVRLKVDNNNTQHLSTPISEMGITRDVARLASLGLTHAVAWLNVIPSPLILL